MLENGFEIFIGFALAALIGLFLYGWRQRRQKPPAGVKPLNDDDWDSSGTL